MDSPGGDDHDDGEDVDMDAPGEKLAGKRPDFGPQANVHNGSMTTLIYSADGSLAAIGSEDTSVIIWDVAGNKRAQTRLKVTETPSPRSHSRVTIAISHLHHTTTSSSSGMLRGSKS